MTSLFILIAKDKNGEGELYICRRCGSYIGIPQKTLEKMDRCPYCLASVNSLRSYFDRK